MAHAPSLVEAHKKYGEKGVVFFAMTDEGSDTKDKTEDFVKKCKITWRVGYGAKDSLKEYGVTAYPTTFVVGANGKVVWNDDANGGGGTMEAAIEKALAAKK